MTHSEIVSRLEMQLGRPEVTPANFRIYFHLLQGQMRVGTPFDVTSSQIARATGLSKQTANEGVLALTELGLIESVLQGRVRTVLAVN